MKVEKVTVFGAGQLGAQLVFHIAYKGFDVTVYDLDDGLLEEARTKFREFGEDFKKMKPSASQEADNALARIAYSKDITEAVGNADVAIEAVPDDYDLKKEFFASLGKVAPRNTIFSSTTSSRSLKDIADASGRSNKFLALHFDDKIWEDNHAEVISFRATDKQALDTIISFISDLGKQVRNIEVTV